MYKLINEIPEKLKKNAINLDSLGFKEIAWKYNDAKEVLDWLKSRKRTVLGGDVYRINNNTIFITYDNWYYEGNNYLSSINIAQEYISKYYYSKGNKFIYSFIVDE